MPGNIRQDEIEDFQTVVRQHGRDAVEFALSVRTVSAKPGEPSPLDSIVIVVNRETGQTKSYRRGPGVDWLSKFGLDLGLGLL